MIISPCAFCNTNILWLKLPLLLSFSNMGFLFPILNIFCSAVYVFFKAQTKSSTTSLSVEWQSSKYLLSFCKMFCLYPSAWQNMQKLCLFHTCLPLWLWLIFTVMCNTLSSDMIISVGAAAVGSTSTGLFNPNLLMAVWRACLLFLETENKSYVSCLVVSTLTFLFLLIACWNRELIYFPE